MTSYGLLKDHAEILLIGDCTSLTSVVAGMPCLLISGDRFWSHGILDAA
jgi:hypothetical protein